MCRTKGARYSVNDSSAVIRKRSYRRAMQRLGAQGFAKYRGQTFFGRRTLKYVADGKKQFSIRRRLKYAVWNCGGLSSQLYAEVLYSAKVSAVDILLLQETHWSQSSEWQDEDWCFVHSAASKCRSGGVLVGIRKEKVNVRTLKWSELVPGRLLHVRGTLDGTPCDILNVYQKARVAGADEAVQKNLAERALVWRQLSRCLGGLPYRNLVLVAGDLNTVLPRTAGLTGNSAAEDQGGRAYKAEAAETADALLRAGLVACNTYGRRRATYVHATGESLIDYVFTRRTSADAEARKASAVETPLAGWRKGGHRVLVGSIAVQWAPWRHRPLDLGGSQVAVLEDDSTQALRDTRAAAEEVNVVPVQRVRLPKMETLEPAIAQYWESRTAFKDGGVGTLRQCFDLLREHGRMMRLHRQLRARARGRKRQRNLEVLEKAERAARTGDSRTLFQCVKLLSGSKVSGRLRLRDENEALISAERESEVLARYASKLFGGEHYKPPPLQPPGDWLEEWRWRQALKELKAGKAVPRGQPPIAASSEISKRALCGLDPHVPVGWCSVQLAWLPKPPKPPTLPQHLRSVGLTPGDSKAFLLVLKEQLSDSVFAALGDTPQSAYRKGMDTHAAILRATQRCHVAREVLQRRRLDHTSRVAGVPRCRLAGGMVVSLDLAKAFDSVPRVEIQLGVDMRLIAVVMRVHTQTQCIIRQAGREASTMMQRGLRQGCPLAPVLYAAWTSRLCRISDASLGDGWCNSHSSIFADDTLGYWDINSAGDMRKAIREVGCLFSVFRQLGLTVNIEKSGVMLSITGADKYAMLRACACQWKGKHQLRVPVEGGAFMFRSLQSCSSWEWC